VSPRVKAALALCGLLTGCLQMDADPVYSPVSLPPPYSSWADPPADTPIEPGMPIKLDARQQEAVVVGVRGWMKDPGSAWFGAMSGVKLRQGRIAVCGEVDGRNSAGVHPGMARFVGVMMGTPRAPEFVVVGLARNGKARAEIDSICQKSGII
jgi:hypothetical protein